MLRTLAFAAVLALGSGSASAQVFPKNFCDTLQPVSPRLFEALKARAPEMAEGGVIKEVPFALALETVEKGVKLGLGSIDLFTDDGFRGDCVFFMSRKTMVGLEDRYSLDLVAPVYHDDKDGKRFETAGMVAGKGKIYIFYDRDDIHYDNEGAHREFRLHHTVRITTPEHQVLSPIEGVFVHVFIFGDLPIKSISHQGGKLKIKAGNFDADADWTPISPKGLKLDTAPADSAMNIKLPEFPNATPAQPARDAAALQSLQFWASPK